MSVMRLMLLMLVAGLVISGVALYLLLFTALVNEGGIRGIFVVVGLISVGLLLLIPAKVYIIIWLTKRGK